MNKSYFITGIGTGIGKTVTSAVLVKYFSADYWKPIQSGDLDQSDSHQVQYLAGFETKIHPERFRLKFPASPHQSAAMENIDIKVGDFQLPKVDNSLLVEGAGGLFVPLNQEEFVIDLIQSLKLPVVLVIRDYLGCINHSLLSLEALKSRNIPLEYIVFNGMFQPATKSILINHFPDHTKYIELPDIENLSPENINSVVNQLEILEKINI